VHTEPLQPDKSGIRQKKAQDGITSTSVTLRLLNSKRKSMPITGTLLYSYDFGDG